MCLRRDRKNRRDSRGRGRQSGLPPEISPAAIKRPHSNHPLRPRLGSPPISPATSDPSHQIGQLRSDGRRYPMEISSFRWVIGAPLTSCATGFLCSYDVEGHEPHNMLGNEPLSTCLPLPRQLFDLHLLFLQLCNTTLDSNRCLQMTLRLVPLIFHFGTHVASCWIKYGRRLLVHRRCLLNSVMRHLHHSDSRATSRIKNVLEAQAL